MINENINKVLIKAEWINKEEDLHLDLTNENLNVEFTLFNTLLFKIEDKMLELKLLREIPKEFSKYVINYSLSRRTVNHLKIKLNEETGYNILYLFNVLKFIKLDTLEDDMNKLREFILSYILIHSIKGENVIPQLSWTFESEEFIESSVVYNRKNVVSLGENIKYIPVTKMKLENEEMSNLETKVEKFLNKIYSKAFTLNVRSESDKIGKQHFNLIDYTFGYNDKILTTYKERFYKFKYVKPLMRKSIMFIYSLIKPLEIRSFFNPLYTYCIMDTFKNKYISNWSSLHLFPSEVSKVQLDVFEDELNKEFTEINQNGINPELLDGDYDGDSLRVLEFLYRKPFPGKISILHEDYKFFNIIPTFYNNSFDDLYNFSLNMNDNLIKIYSILSILPLTSILFNSMTYTNYKSESDNITNVFELADSGIIIKGNPFMSIDSILNGEVKFEYTKVDNEYINEVFNFNFIKEELGSIVSDKQIIDLFNQFFKDPKNNKIETFDYKYFKMLIELSILDLMYFKYKFDKEYIKFHTILTTYNNFSTLYRLDPSIKYNINTDISEDSDKYTIYYSNSLSNGTVNDYTQTLNSYSNDSMDDDRMGVLSERIFLKDLLVLLQMDKLSPFNHLVSSKILLEDLDFYNISNDFKERVINFEFVHLKDYNRKYFDLNSKILEYRSRLFEVIPNSDFEVRKNLIIQTISDSTNSITLSGKNNMFLDLRYNNDLESSVYSKNFIMDNVCVPQLNYKLFDIFVNLNQMFTNAIKEVGIKYKNTSNIFKILNMNLLHNSLICNYQDILNRELSEDKDNIIEIFKEIGYFDLEFRRIDNFGDKFQMVFNLEEELDKIISFIAPSEVNKSKNSINSETFKDKLNLFLSVCKTLDIYPNLEELNMILRNEIMNNKEEYSNIIKRLTRLNLFSSLKILNIIINTIIFHRGNSLKRLNSLFSQSELQFLVLSRTSNHNNLLYQFNDRYLDKDKLNTLSDYLDDIEYKEKMIKTELKRITNDGNDISNLNIEDFYFNTLSNSVNCKLDSIFIHDISLLTQSLTFSEFINLLSKNTARDIHNHLEPLIISFNSVYYNNSLLGTKNEIGQFSQYLKSLAKRLSEDIVQDKIFISKYNKNIYENISKYDDMIMSLIQTLFNRKNYNLELYKIFLTSFRVYLRQDYELLSNKLKTMNLRDFVTYFNDYYLSSFIYNDFLHMNIEDILEKRLEIVDYENKNIKVHFHKHNDPICIKLGDITNCCQTVNGVASSSVKEGLLNPYSGFISIQKEGKIIAQSWIWLDSYKNILVLDSVESRYPDLIPLISKSLHEWSKLQKYNIAIGCRYTKLDKEYMNRNNWTLFDNYKRLNIENDIHDIDSLTDSINNQVEILNNDIKYYNEIISKNKNSSDYNLDLLKSDIMLDKYKDNKVNTLRMTNSHVYTDASSDLFINYSEVL